MTEKGGCPEFEPRAGHQISLESQDKGEIPQGCPSEGVRVEFYSIV